MRFEIRINPHHPRSFTFRLSPFTGCISARSLRCVAVVISKSGNMRKMPDRVVDGYKDVSATRLYGNFN
jgi:hypothetical protein